MTYEVFNTEQEKREAITSLPQLVETQGWQTILRALDANVVFLKEQLTERTDFANLEELYYLQERIRDLEAMKNLPQTLLEAAQDIDEPEDPDPY